MRYSKHKKMNIKQIFVSLLMLFTCIGFWAQETDTDYSSFPVWIEMMNQENVNMNEARKAFETYWKHNTRHQGDKVNKFERWYTINSNRLDKYGNVISAEQVKREFQRMRRCRLAYEGLRAR